jgi:hypothetical protein
MAEACPSTQNDVTDCLLSELTIIVMAKLLCTSSANIPT